MAGSVSKPGWLNRTWFRTLLRALLPPALCFVLLVAAIFAIILPSVENQLMLRKREALKQVLQPVFHVLEFLCEQERSGALSSDAAQQEAMQYVRSLRYGDDRKDYFWISDLHPHVIVHPYVSELEGTDVNEYADPRGKLVFVEFAAAVRKNRATQDGFVDYYWQWKDDPTRVVAKISYVRLFEPWQWVLGTGMYIEDVRSEISRLTRHIVYIATTVIVLVLMLTGYLTWQRMRAQSLRDLAEQSLRDSEEKFRAVVASSKDGIITVNEEGQIAVFNPAAERIFGRSAREMIGGSLDCLIVDEYRGQHQEYVREFFHGTGRGLIGKTLELPAVRPDGVTFPIELSLSAGEHAHGNFVMAVIRDITDRKRVQEELANARALLQAAIEACPAGILIAGAPDATEIRLVNSAALAIHGDTTESLEASRRENRPATWKIFHSDGRRVAFEDLPLTRAIRSGETAQNRNLVIHRPDGTQRWVLANASPVRNAQRDIVAGVVVFLDVTDLKEAEDALRRSEERYRLLFEAANDAIIILQGTTVVECNRRALDMLGCARNQFVGQSVIAFCPEMQPDGQDSQTQVLERTKAAEAGEPQFFDFKVLRYDGTEFDGEVNLNRLDLSGTLLTLAIVRDVTERKCMEGERARLAAAIEQAAEHVVITDIEGIIEYVNPAFEKVTGYSRAEAVGQNPRFLKSGVHDEAYYRELWETIRSGQVWTGHMVNRTKDGRLLEEEANIAPIFNAQGQIVGYVATKRDVTEEALLEEQLRQAQKMEAIGTLAGGIAHDFNNVLGAVIGYTELSLMEIEDGGSEAQQFLEESLKAAERAKSLIDQILAFSRRTDQERKPLRVVPVFKEIAKLLRATIPTTVDVRTQINCSSDTILGDPTQVHQVLMNLCTNAAHAMRGTTGVLSLRVDEQVLGDEDALKLVGEVQPGRFLRLEVTDTGIGMPPDTLKRIFEPFFTTKPQGEGTGMGLAVVHGIVASHHGALRVSSSPGKGTTFEVFLPLLITDEPEDGDGEAGPLPHGAGEHILLVDDETALVEILSRMLQRLQYRVTIANDGSSALQCFQEQPDAFDLVLTDQTMPRMTGIELALHVHSLRPETPVILCTGYSEQVSEDRVVRAGIQELLRKPIDIHRLADLVAHLLAARQRA